MIVACFNGNVLCFSFSVVLDLEATRLESLSSRLVRHDAIEGFANNCEKICEDWTSLLRKTTLPPNVASSDTRVIAAFRAVDSVISGKQSTFVLRWLAYVRLMALCDSLKPVVRAERETGEAHRERGDRDINAVIDIYENAQRPADWQASEVACRPIIPFPPYLLR